MNPEISNNDSEKIEILNPKYDFATLTASGAITVPAGKVLAFHETSGKYNLTKSGAAKQANAKAVLAQSKTYAAPGDARVRIIIGGEIREDQLVFDGSDTISTIPSGAKDSFKLMLRDYGIITRIDADIDELDNQ